MKKWGATADRAPSYPEHFAARARVAIHQRRHRVLITALSGRKVKGRTRYA